MTAQTGLEPPQSGLKGRCPSRRARAAWWAEERRIELLRDVAASHGFRDRCRRLPSAGSSIAEGHGPAPWSKSPVHHQSCLRRWSRQGRSNPTPGYPSPTSGWLDLNQRPPGFQPGAHSTLRHIPLADMVGQRAVPGSRTRFPCLEGEAHLYTLTWAFADLACPGAGAVVPASPPRGRQGTALLVAGLSAPVRFAFVNEWIVRGEGHHDGAMRCRATA